MTKIFIGGFVLALLSIAVYQTQTSQDVLREGGYDFIVGTLRENTSTWLFVLQILVAFNAKNNWRVRVLSFTRWS
jgi:hypothetical protein